MDIVYNLKEVSDIIGSSTHSLRDAIIKKRLTWSKERDPNKIAWWVSEDDLLMFYLKRNYKTLEKDERVRMAILPVLKEILQDKLKKPCQS